MNCLVVMILRFKVVYQSVVGAMGSFLSHNFRHRKQSIYSTIKPLLPKEWWGPTEACLSIPVKYSRSVRDITVWLCLYGHTEPRQPTQGWLLTFRWLP